jgi:hypothetical protein
MADVTVGERLALTLNDERMHLFDADGHRLSAS